MVDSQVQPRELRYHQRAGGDLLGEDAIGQPLRLLPAGGGTGSERHDPCHVHPMSYTRLASEIQSPITTLAKGFELRDMLSSLQL